MKDIQHMLGQWAVQAMKLLMDKGLTHLFHKIFIQLHSHKMKMGDYRRRCNEIEADFFDKCKCKLFMTNKGEINFNAE